MLSSKVTIVEETPRVRGVPSVSTSIAGAIGVTERGPIGEPVLVSSFEEFTHRFGGFTLDSDLALAAMGFFENGGAQLWVVRTVHYADILDEGSLAASHASAPAFTAVEDPSPAVAFTIRGKDPGAYANHIEVEIKPASSGDAEAFDLAIIEDGLYQEVFADLSLAPESPRYIEALVNHTRAGSALINIQAVGGVLHIEPQTISLEGGDDGLAELEDTDFIGSEASKTGLHALDAVQNLSILLVPGRATAAVHNAMVNYCEQRGFIFAILDPPPEQSAAQIIEYLQTSSLEGLSEHAAIYWPRLEVLNPAKAVFGAADRVVVPPSGIIAGVYARTDAARPGGVYDPPAGVDKGRMRGVLGFESREVLEERKRDLVYPKRINPLTTGPGLPRYIDGSRTLKGDGNFPYIAERRGVNFIERSIKQGLQFARHQNNTEGLRAQVRRTLTAFLITQMNNNAFRSHRPDEAFFVDVSDALNTPTNIFAGKLIARVGLATNKPAEFVIVMLSQDVRALEAELAGNR